MKNLLLSAICVFGLIANAQENKTWRIGVQWGAQGNHAKFEGGMSEANARFNENKFGGGAFGLVARYDFNNRWMATAGLGYNSFGFEFALAENYSFIHKGKRFSDIKSEFGSLEIPAMLFYKFNPNCKNARWLVGGGFVETFISAQTMDKNISQAADGGTNINYLSSTASAKSGTYIMLRWAIAREKMFKCGSILNASLLFNVGFRDVAHATVNYTVDNQLYTHNFSNNGSFVGFRLAYYFKTLGKSAAPSAYKSVK